MSGAAAVGVGHRRAEPEQLDVPVSRHAYVGGPQLAMHQAAPVDGTQAPR